MQIFQLRWWKIFGNPCHLTMWGGLIEKGLILNLGLEVMGLAEGGLIENDWMIERKEKRLVIELFGNVHLFQDLHYAYKRRCIKHTLQSAYCVQYACPNTSHGKLVGISKSFVTCQSFLFSNQLQTRLIHLVRLQLEGSRDDDVTAK